MYSIRPHSSGEVQLDLPTTMYAVRPIIETENAKIEAIRRDQDRLLAKIEQIFRQLELVEEQRNPRREELVVRLSVKKPSEKILQLLAESSNVRVYRHSSAGEATVPTTTGKGQGRPVVLIWADGENLPSMYHARMTVNDEEQIVNLLRNELKECFPLHKE